MTGRRNERADPSPAPVPVPEPTPGLGGLVYYRLTAVDASRINACRQESEDAPRAHWGYQAHAGNRAHAGQVFPATVVRLFGTTPGSVVNLQVHLDGTDTLWATSIMSGTARAPGPGRPDRWP